MATVAFDCGCTYEMDPEDGEGQECDYHFRRGTTPDEDPGPDMRAFEEEE